MNKDFLHQINLYKIEINIIENEKKMNLIRNKIYKSIHQEQQIHLIQIKKIQ